MSNEAPEIGEVWQESDSHLLKCFAPGIWARFGSAVVVPPNDPSIVFPLRRVFTKYGVPTMDDPIKEALLDDLALAQADRDRWRERAVWLSDQTVPMSVVAGQEESSRESGFVPPPIDLT